MLNLLMTESGRIRQSLIDLIAAWAGQFLFDIVIFAMTLWRTLKLSKENSIGLLMMRDGMCGSLVHSAQTAVKCLILIGTVYFG